MSEVVTYDLELEDHDWVESLDVPSNEFLSYSRPTEVPIDWHRSENQGGLGSCQGQSITSACEGVEYVETGDKIQLSRICAYLWTQKIDGLLGRDAGSTITGGGKVAQVQGFPVESLTGYPTAYPRDYRKYFTQALFDAAKSNLFPNIRRISSDPDEALTLLGAGAKLSFGIPWYSGLIPRDRLVKDFSSTGNNRSGHAMFAGGYDSSDYIRCANSHNDGPYRITPQAWKKMMSHRYSVVIAVLPKANRPIDWDKGNPLRPSNWA